VEAHSHDDDAVVTLYLTEIIVILITRVTWYIAFWLPFLMMEIHWYVIWCYSTLPFCSFILSMTSIRQYVFCLCWWFWWVYTEWCCVAISVCIHWSTTWKATFVLCWSTYSPLPHDGEAFVLHDDWLLLEISTFWWEASWKWSGGYPFCVSSEVSVCG